MLFKHSGIDGLLECPSICLEEPLQSYNRRKLKFSLNGQRIDRAFNPAEAFRLLGSIGFQAHKGNELNFPFGLIIGSGALRRIGVELPITHLIGIQVVMKISLLGEDDGFGVLGHDDSSLIIIGFRLFSCERRVRK